MDNTLIFCNANEDREKNVKAILLCNEEVLVPKVNFYKSELLGVQVNNVLTSSMADILGCKVGCFPTTYQGLPLCCGNTHKSVWDLVSVRVEKKLSSWKANYLSFGGTVTRILSF